ncbi:MAG: deoxyribonuclease IV [bacterium]
MMKKKEPIVGAHVSIAGGLHNSIKEALSIGATTMQIFTKSNRSYTAKALTQKETTLFKQAVKESGLQKITAHCSYLINIGSPKIGVANKSVTALAKELSRCEQLDIPYLVIHPGSHLGSGEDACIKQIAKNLDTILANATGTTKICLETMAGQGTNIGSTFEQLKNIIDLCKHKEHLGTCLDTCHIFSAGYDISSEKKYHEVMDTFCKIIGISRLQVVHVNDSKTPCGSHIDRHETLGKGTIPRNAFKALMNDKRLENVPKILETPDPDLYAEEIAMLKKMVK